MIISLGKYLFNSYKSLRIKAIGKCPRWVLMPGGYQMWFDPGDAYDQQMLMGQYEPSLFRLIPMLVKEGDTCVDVGTQKGYFTLWMAKNVGQSGKVLAVDPDPRAFAVLERNVRQNGYDNVEAYPIGLGNDQGYFELAVADQIGYSSRFPNKEIQSALCEYVRVKVETLDAVIAGCREAITSLSFIKIDAEGSEPLILEGMQNTIGTYRPTIFMEINVASLAAADRTPEELLSMVNELGYRVFRVNWKRNRFGRARVELDPNLEFSEETITDVLCIFNDSLALTQIKKLEVGK